MGLVLFGGLLLLNRPFLPMNDDDSRSKPSDTRGRALAQVGSLDAVPDDRRRNSVFTDIDEDYKESERDTNYVSAYEEEESEEKKCLESQEEDDPAKLSMDWQLLNGGSGTAIRSIDTNRSPWDMGDSVGTGIYDSDMDAKAFGTAPKLVLLENQQEEESDPADVDSEQDRDGLPIRPRTLKRSPRKVHIAPLGLTIVGLVALMLLATGGYSVIQGRSAAQEEIRHLRAALATAASPTEVVANKEALWELEQQTAKNLATIEVLNLYNKRLTDTLARLEKQLPAPQAEAPSVSESGQVTTIETTAKPSAENASLERASNKTAAAVVERGGWFVNFSSYDQRSAAEYWVNKLSPLAGKTLVVRVNQDGKTFYRLRIVGLADRAEAEKVASELQSVHNVPPLWVGKE